MNYFSIKDVELLSGIKAHTLRIWEQRHGLRLCKRKESLHRYYDNEDLKHILRIAYLYHNGYKISKIALLPKDEIIKLSTTIFKANEYDKYINLMIESGLDYDQPAFEKVLHASIAEMGFEQTVIKVIYPYLEKIGLLWLTEHVIPAHEHFTSYIIQKEVLLAIDGLKQVEEGKGMVVLIFLPVDELHEIPLLFIHYLFKKKGVKTVYFGSGTTMNEIVFYCRYKKITHLYFHKLINFLHESPAMYMTEMIRLFPEKKIIASGPALNGLESFPGVEVLQSLDEIFGCLNQLANELSG